MRIIIAFIVALLLAACAQPVTLTPAPVSRQVVAFGTLSTNACEAQTAGPYTVLAASRYRAAGMLRSGAMKADAAQRVQSLADQARSELDGACVKGQPDAARVARAKGLLGDIQSILER